jgi:membrane protease YdiL (CAAX protease family)
VEINNNQSIENNILRNEQQSSEDLHNNINPDNPPWNSIAAFGMWFFSIVVLFVLSGAAILMYAIANGTIGAANSSEAKLQLDPNMILVGLLTTLPVHLLTIAVAWLLVTNAGKYPFWQTLGWNWGRNFGFWASLGTAVCFFLLAGLIISLFGETDNELMRILRSSRSAVYVTAFMATVTAPLVEETVYRGVLYPAFRRTFGTAGSIAFVTLLFAGVHYWQYRESPGVLIAILLLSLVLTTVRAWTGNLLPCFVIHTVFNGIQSVLLIVEPFLPKTNAPTELPSVFILPFLFK